MKDFAESRGIWSYCNPLRDSSVIAVTPTRPVLPARPTRVEMADDAFIKIHNIEMKYYEAEFREWKLTDESLRQMLDRISATVDNSLIAYIVMERDPYRKMVIL